MQESLDDGYKDESSLCFLSFCRLLDFIQAAFLLEPAVPHTEVPGVLSIMFSPSEDVFPSSCTNSEWPGFLEYLKQNYCHKVSLPVKKVVFFFFKKDNVFFYFIVVLALFCSCCRLASMASPSSSEMFISGFSGRAPSVQRAQTGRIINFIRNEMLRSFWSWWLFL